MQPYYTVWWQSGEEWGVFGQLSFDHFKSWGINWRRMEFVRLFDGSLCTTLMKITKHILRFNKEHTKSRYFMVLWSRRQESRRGVKARIIIYYSLWLLSAWRSFRYDWLLISWKADTFWQNCLWPYLYRKQEKVIFTRRSEVREIHWNDLKWRGIVWIF